MQMEEYVPGPDEPLYTDRLRHNPEDLVGEAISATAMKRGWNPDGIPNRLSSRHIVSADEEDGGVLFLFRTAVHLGVVEEYDSDEDVYVVRYDGEAQVETGSWPNETELYEGENTLVRRIPADRMRTQIHRGITSLDGEFTGWWVE